MIKLIALDLDGTLLPEDHRLPVRTAALLRGLTERGVHVVFASGRSRQATQKVQEMAGITGQAMVFHNGAIVKTRDGPATVLGSASMEAAEGLYNLCAEQGWNLSLIFGEGQLAVCNSRDEFLLHVMRTHNQCEPEIAASFEPVRLYCQKGIPLTKIFISSENEGQSYKIATTLREKFPHQLETHVTGPRYVDITPLGVSKGAGLAFLLAKLGVTPEEVLAIGDGENDISMLTLAGTSVAMDNALESVKKAAQHLTASNEMEGVRLAIERFGGFSQV